MVVQLYSKKEAEIAGLDIPEMVAECYSDYELKDKTSLRVNIKKSNQPGGKLPPDCGKEMT